MLPRRVLKPILATDAMPESKTVVKFSSCLFASSEEVVVAVSYFDVVLPCFSRLYTSLLAFRKFQ